MRSTGTLLRLRLVRRLVAVFFMASTTARFCRGFSVTATTGRNGLAVAAVFARSSRTTSTTTAAFQSPTRAALAFQWHDRIRLFSTTNDESNDNDDSSGWIVPKFIAIPEDQLDMSFIRSSGAGGQAVNKLSTQVQIRLHVPSAYWIPFEVRQRLAQQQHNRISKEDILTLQVQEHRTQSANRKTAVAKLQSMVLAAWPRPKIRQLRKGVSRRAKERNKEDKRKRGQVKQNRGRVDF